MVLVYSLKDGGQKKFSDRFPTAMANLIEADFAKGPTHYTPYGTRCRIDRNISIKSQKMAFGEMTKLIFDFGDKTYVCSPLNLYSRL